LQEVGHLAIATAPIQHPIRLGQHGYVVGNSDVVPHADGLIGNRTREHPVQRLRDAGTSYAKLPHVTAVEQRNVVPRMVVLVKDAAVLDWHIPSAKPNHPRLQFQMLLVSLLRWLEKEFLTMLTSRLCFLLDSDVK